MPSTINADNGVSSGSAGLKSTADSSGVLSLQTNGTTAVTVDTSQNVGVGTASPAYKLDVNGVVKNTGAFRSISGSVDGIFGAGQFASGVVGLGSVSNHPLTFNTNLTEYMRIDTSGNVGIGTSSPTALGAGRTSVNINGSTDSVLWMMSNSVAIGYLQGTSTSFNIVGTTNQNVITTAQGTGVISWITGGGERARIDSSGNLMVGTTSSNPISSRVNGISLSPSNGFIFRLASQSSAFGLPTTSGTHIGFYTDNGSAAVSAGYISSNGGTTAYNATSDYRLKDNVRPLSGALARLAQLRPVQWTWKEGFGGTQPECEGFIAHELAEVCPQAVTGEKDAVNEDGSIKPQGVDTSFLVAILTAAIQELKAEVDSLKSQLAAKG